MYGTSNLSPCCYCNKRYPACHDACKEYSEWRETRSQLKQKEKAVKRTYELSKTELGFINNSRKRRKA